MSYLEADNSQEKDFCTVPINTNDIWVRPASPESRLIGTEYPLSDLQGVALTKSGETVRLVIKTSAGEFISTGEFYALYRYFLPEVQEEMRSSLCSINIFMSREIRPLVEDDPDLSLLKYPTHQIVIDSTYLG